MPRPIAAFVSPIVQFTTRRAAPAAASSLSLSRSAFTAATSTSNTFARPPRFAPACSPSNSRRAFVTCAADMSDFTTQPNGLRLKDVTVGNGATVDDSAKGKSVSVHYLLTLNGFSEEGGQKVDSSYDRGREFSYRCASGGVIAGWDQGVMGMKIGGKRRLIIPPELGYGAAGAGGVIPGNATLFFEIELSRIG